jgi:hypothetical protein
LREQPRRLASRAHRAPPGHRRTSAAKAAGREPALHPLAEGQQARAGRVSVTGRPSAHGHGPVAAGPFPRGARRSRPTRRPPRRGRNAHRFRGCGGTLPRPRLPAPARNMTRPVTLAPAPPRPHEKGEQVRVHARWRLRPDRADQARGIGQTANLEL